MFAAQLQHCRTKYLAKVSHEGEALVQIEPASTPSLSLLEVACLGGVRLRLYYQASSAFQLYPSRLGWDRSTDFSSIAHPRTCARA